MTRDLLDTGASILFEAAFESGRNFAAIDVLIREPRGFRAIEVKMQSGRNPPADDLLDETAFEYRIERPALACYGC